MNHDNLLAAAVQAARTAGLLLREGFGTVMERRSKEGLHNIVTEYDIRCEQLIVDHLRSVFPDSGFTAEEGGASRADADLHWVIDPLDGTVNFAHGIPVFCVSIAAVLHGELVCGAIYNPSLDELFTATRGQGAWLNGRRLHVTATEFVRESILVTGFPYNVNENPDHCIDQFVSMIRQGIPIRRLGSAALDLAYVAAGRFDGYWEVSLHPWDMAAGVLMVQEAGGTVTHYDNRPFVLGKDSIVATNGIIHDELVAILDGAQR